MANKKTWKYQYECSKCEKVFSTQKYFQHKPICPDCDTVDDLLERCKIDDKKGEKVKSKIPDQKGIFQELMPKPKMECTVSLFRIDAEVLNYFIYPENRRKIYPSQLKQLVRILESGKHFEVPIVVNQREGYNRVLDGNHRLESIKEMVKKYPKFSIPVQLVVYRDLTEEQEISIFRTWNLGKIQSVDDFIQSIAHKIDFIRWLKDDFPIDVTVYRTAKSVPVRMLCSALISAKKKDQSGRGIRREHFEDNLNSLTREDFNFLKLWVGCFIDVFGKPSAKNKYWRKQFFSPATYVAYQYRNKDEIPALMMQELLGNEDVLEHTELSGAKAHELIVGKIYDKLRLKPR